MPDSSADRLPVDRLEFKPADRAVEFRAGGKLWRCDLNTYQLAELKEETGSSPADVGQTSPPARTAAGQGAGRGGRAISGLAISQSLARRQMDGFDQRPQRVVIRGRTAKRKSNSPTTAAKGSPTACCNGRPIRKRWRRFGSSRANRRKCILSKSSPPGGGRAVLHSRPYALPGDKFTAL